MSGNSGNYSAAIYNLGGNPSFTNLTISNNAVTYIGAMHMENSSYTLTNSTISGNTTPFQVGGVYNVNSFPIIRNVTLTGNTDSQLYNVGGSSPTLRNVIINGECLSIPNNVQMKRLRATT